MYSMKHKIYKYQINCLICIKNSQNLKVTTSCTQYISSSYANSLHIRCIYFKSFHIDPSYFWNVFICSMLHLFLPLYASTHLVHMMMMMSDVYICIGVVLQKLEMWKQNFFYTLKMLPIFFFKLFKWM